MTRLGSWEAFLRALSIIDTRQIYDWVFGIYVPIGLGVFALFTLTIIGLVVRGRHSKRARPSRRNEANAVEISYAVLLTLTAAFLLYITFKAEHRVDVATAQENPAVTIDVTGSRWEWTYRYPAYDITHESGAVKREPLVVPTNEPVRFRLTSADVIHSFWIPQLRFKRDTIPGAVETVTLDFDRAGHFLGSCAEYCGIDHADMVFPVDAISPTAFTAWAKQNRGSR